MSSVWWKGLVGRQAESDGSEAISRLGRQGELITSFLKGQFAEKAQRGEVFSASAAAVTIPANAVNLVSVFSIFNPLGSGRILEILDTVIMNVLVDTVVNLYSWYYSGPALAGLHTFTTLGTIQNRRLGDGVASAGKFYSALTHSGTPILAAPIGGTGAVTSTGGSISRAFNGSLMVPPGVVISLAASTAAGTAAGNTPVASWTEHPL